MKPKNKNILIISLFAVILLMALVSSLMWGYFVQREANRNLFLYIEAKKSLDKSEKKYIALEGKFLGLVEKYIELVEEKKVSLGSWEKRTISAYTSYDAGVNEISAIRMNIARWSMYGINFCAVAGDSDIGYGDVLLIKMPDGTIKAWIVVDTGGGLSAEDTEKAEIDLYMGYDLEEAFRFGKRKLEVWIIKS